MNINNNSNATLDSSDIGGPVRNGASTTSLASSYKGS